MANRNNGIKSVAKPEFTDYTVAGTPQGIVHAAISRAVYQQERDYIGASRSVKRMCRKNAVDCLIRNTAQSAIRNGFPTKRERDEDIPSHRGVPYSNFLKRFKIVDRIAYSEALGEFVHSAKIWVLHATRGWKIYA